MNEELLKLIFKRLDVSKIPMNEPDLTAFKYYYSQDVEILLSEIERLNKIIDEFESISQEMNGYEKFKYFNK